MRPTHGTGRRSGCGIDSEPELGSARPDLELLAIGDFVASVGLSQPAELHEGSDCLVDAFAAGADHAGQLFLGDRKHEFVGIAGQLENALGRAPGDIKKYRIGQRGIHRAQSAREQPDHAPKGFRAIVVMLLDRAIRNRNHLGRLECAGFGRATVVVEEAHLTEQIAGRP